MTIGGTLSNMMKNDNKITTLSFLGILISGILFAQESLTCVAQKDSLSYTWRSTRGYIL
jgi:hypothetical protein